MLINTTLLSSNILSDSNSLMWCNTAANYEIVWCIDLISNLLSWYYALLVTHNGIPIIYSIEICNIKNKIKLNNTLNGVREVVVWKSYPVSKKL